MIDETGIGFWISDVCMSQAAAIKGCIPYPNNEKEKRGGGKKTKKHSGEDVSAEDQSMTLSFPCKR